VVLTQNEQLGFSVVEDETNENGERVFVLRRYDY